MHIPHLDNRDIPGLLQALAQHARTSGRLALDTEFMGEGRYRTLLCLIQLAVSDGERGDGDRGERIELIDPLAAQRSADEDWGAALADVLADPSIEIVVHAGRQDIALLRRVLKCEPRNIFDTQVAAGFLGMPAQSSYESLLSEMLSVRLAKSASFTRWNARPLTPEQLSYAREDVVHLSELADELQTRLEQRGRLQWAREECEFLEQVSDERDLETIFSRLPRIRGLNATSQGVARELVAWRERTAARRDKPVQSVLGDAPLVEIAKRKPSSARQLSDIRGVGQGNSHRGAEELLGAVKRGLERSEEPLAGGPRPPQPQPEDSALIALAEALVRARAREAGLAYELLAARADLQAIVTGERVGEEAQVRTLHGWRRELVGEELLSLLAGDVSLTVKERAIRVERR